MKIRSRINIGYLSVYVVIMSLVGVVVGLYTTGIIKKNINSYFQSSNHARAEHIRTFIQDQKRMSEILAAASVYRDFLTTPTTSDQYPVVKGKIDKRFIRTIEVDPSIDEVFILDASGRIVASSKKVYEGADKSQDPYYFNAKDVTYFKDVYFSETTKKLNYTISTPITDSNGNLLGISVLRFLPENFFSVTYSENGLGDSEENFLINRDKFFLTPSRFFGESVILKQKVETKNAQNCFNPQEEEYVRKNGYNGLIKKFGSQIVNAKDYRNVNVIATHAYIPETGWCLITKADKSDVLSFRFWLILIFSITFLIAALVFLILGLIISRLITKPINELYAATKKIEQGDFDYKNNISTNDEIGVLAKAFDKMVSTVKQSRIDIEKKVKEQTKEIGAKAQDLEKQKSAILNILEDVEEEKIKSELLAQDLEKFKMAVDNASDQVVITDVEGIVVYGNRATEAITGYKPEEALGKKSGTLWKSSLMPVEFYQRLWDTIKNQKKTFIDEIQNKRKNGQIYTAKISISPVLDSGGKIIYFVGLERDITKEKEVDKAKTEFVSLASHQLRTPLSAINWYTEMLLAGDAGQINEEQKKYLQEVATGNQRMVDLVNALLNVSRLELGTFVVEPELIDVVKLAQSVVDEQKQQIKIKKIKFTQDYDNKIPNINADPKLLRMVFQNLLSNAVKYTPENGQISLEIDLSKNNISIKMSDTGYGIPKAQQEKIFSKLFRADNVREKDAEGTGLGLYIVKAIVDHSGGKIWFESQENRGTTFFITLPLSGMKKKAGTKSLG